jgi:hypothetical protein
MIVKPAEEFEQGEKAMMKCQISRLALIVCLAFGFGLASAHAIECASPQPIEGSKPTPVSAELERQLSAPDVYSNIPELFAAVRALYPKASSPAIVNYLIASFCPIVNATPGIGEDLKTARLKSFANGVVAAAY